MEKVMYLYLDNKFNKMLSPAQVDSRMWILMNDEERMNLTDRIDQLLTDIDQMKEDGKIVDYVTKSGKLAKRGKGKDSRKIYLNLKDYEAIIFLKRMTFYTHYEESEAMDLNVFQRNTIVEKLLKKIYGYGCTFTTWANLVYQDSSELNSQFVRDRMNQKRMLVRAFKNSGELPLEHPEPHSISDWWAN